MGRWAGTMGRTGGIALVTGGLLLAGSGLAGAATPSSVVQVPDLAGYHFTAGTSVTSLTVKGSITMPAVTCGTNGGVFVPEVEVRYYVGTNLETASASFGITCVSGIAIYGHPSLQVDAKTKQGSQQLAAGDTVGITVKISAAGGSVQVAGATAGSSTLAGTGGQPSDVRYAVVLPSPPAYNPVKYTDCKVNGQNLASYNPDGWEAVNDSGQITGELSAISGGTAFTVSP
jgi:hypothetical protein